MNSVLLAWLVIVLLVLLSVFLICTPILMSRYGFSPSSIAGSALCAAQLLLSKPPPRVNIHDSTAIKHVLDEYSANFLVETGFEEDIKLSNVKLILGGVAVVIALAAQFSPLPFPESRQFLLYCVAIYFSLNLLLQLFSFLTERDAILLTKPRRTLSDEERAAKKVPKKKTAAAAALSTANKGLDSVDSILTAHGLCLRSQMSHLDTNYRLILSFRAGLKSAAQAPALSVQSLQQLQQLRKEKWSSIKKDTQVEQKIIATENVVEIASKEENGKLEKRIDKFSIHSSSALSAAAAAINAAANTTIPPPAAAVASLTSSTAENNSDSQTATATQSLASTAPAEQSELSAPFESILLSLSALSFSSTSVSLSNTLPARPSSPVSSSASVAVAAGLSVYADRIFDVCDFFDEKGLFLVDRFTAQLYCLYKDFQEKLAQQLHEKSQ